MKDALSSCDTRVPDKNVTETNGHFYRKLLGSFKHHYVDMECHLMTIQLHHLKRVMVRSIDVVWGMQVSDSVGLGRECP